MGYLKDYGIEGGSGRYYEEAIYGIALLYNIIAAKLSTYLRDFDLTLGKFNILMAIKHQGGSRGISQVDVSKHLIVTPSNMSKLIDKLEKSGLVNRTPLEGDRRVHLLKITSQGSKLLDDIWPGYVEQLKELYSVLKKNKQKDLARMLQEWLSLINRH